MEEYNKVFRELTAQLLRKECRFSERQIRNLSYKQIHDDQTISTGYRGRVVKVSAPLYRALTLKTKRGYYVFDEKPFLRYLGKGKCDFPTLIAEKWRKRPRLSIKLQRQS